MSAAVKKLTTDLKESYTNMMHPIRITDVVPLNRFGLSKEQVDDIINNIPTCYGMGKSAIELANRNLKRKVRYLLTSSSYKSDDLRTPTITLLRDQRPFNKLKKAIITNEGDQRVIEECNTLSNLNRLGIVLTVKSTREELIKFRDALATVSSKQVDSRAFKEFKETIIKSIINSRIGSGVSIGLSAAFAVSGPATQMTLNTFHFAGEASATVGFDDVNRMLSASKKQLHPHMYMHFTDGNYEDNFHLVRHQGTLVQVKEKAKELRSVALQEILINKGILDESEIKEHKIDTLFEKFITLETISTETRTLYGALTKVVFLELNMYSMYQYKLSMADIVSSINIDDGSMYMFWSSQTIRDRDSYLYGKLFITTSSNIKSELSETADITASRFLISRVIGRLGSIYIKDRGIKGVTTSEYVSQDALDLISNVRYLGSEGKEAYSGWELTVNHVKTRTMGISMLDIEELFKSCEYTVMSNYKELTIEVGETEELHNRRIDSIGQYLDNNLHTWVEGVYKSMQKDKVEIPDFASKHLSSLGGKLFVSTQATYQDDKWMISIVEGGIPTQAVLNKALDKKKIFVTITDNIMTFKTHPFNPIRDVQMFTNDDEKVYNNRYIYSIITEGINIDEVVYRDDIDMTRFYVNDFVILEKMFGIDITRFYLITTFINLLSKYSERLDESYLSIIFSFLTSPGVFTGITYMGNKKRDTEPLVMGGVQRAPETAIRAGIFNLSQNTLSANGSSFPGTVARLGTGAHEIVSNIVPQRDDGEDLNRVFDSLNVHSSSIEESKESVEELTIEEMKIKSEKQIDDTPYDTINVSDGSLLISEEISKIFPNLPDEKSYFQPRVIPELSASRERKPRVREERPEPRRIEEQVTLPGIIDLAALYKCLTGGQCSYK